MTTWMDMDRLFGMETAAIHGMWRALQQPTIGLTWLAAHLLVGRSAVMAALLLALVARCEPRNRNFNAKHGRPVIILLSCPKKWKSLGWEVRLSSCGHIMIHPWSQTRQSQCKVVSEPLGSQLCREANSLARCLFHAGPW